MGNPFGFHLLLFGFGFELPYGHLEPGLQGLEDLNDLVQIQLDYHAAVSFRA
jgi:hypothetical protein